MDKTDWKVLYALDKNCRESLNKISRDIRISRNVALYRIDKMKERGIIRGYYTEINNLALGYFNVRFFLKLSNASLKEEQELIDYLLKEKRLMWLSKVFGKWDIDLVYITKDLFDFQEFKSSLMLKFNRIIEEYNVSILTQIYHYPKDYLIDNKKTISKSKALNPNNIKTDKIDIAILRILSNNADINIVDIAKKTKISINTVKSRMNALEKNNIILGYRVLLDTSKLGLQYFKLHVNHKNYLEQDINKFRSFLESKNYIIYLDQYLGGEDFEIELHLKSENEFLEFMDELKEKHGHLIKDHFLIKFSKEYLFKYLPEE